MTKREGTFSPHDRRIIMAAKLAVKASKRTGDILPGYFYDLAGVERPAEASDEP